MSVELLPGDPEEENIYAAPQHPSEPLVAYTAFCLFLEAGTLPNGFVDYEQIVVQLWERNGYKSNYEEIENWSKRFDWMTRAKYYRSGIHQRALSRIQESASELKVRRFAVLNDNLDFCLRLRQKLEPVLEEKIKEIRALDADKAVATYEKLSKLELAILKELRIELGEETVGGVRTINFNIDVLLNALGGEMNIPPEKLEAVRSAFIRKVSELEAENE